MKIFAASALAVLGIFLTFGTKSTEEVVPFFAPPAVVIKPPELKMLVVGDIMLGRNVQLLSERDGGDYPFKNISGYLKQFDIVDGNLEGPIIGNATRTPANTFKFSLPASSSLVLKDAGFDLLSLANNHTFDFGAKGYEETVNRLASEGISSFGSPVSTDGKYIKRVELSGKRLAFFGYNATYPSFDKKSALAAIFAEKAADPGELIFIFIHWGEEYSLSANDFQKNLAREFVDVGATAVFGTHPHVVQGIEVYKGRAIFYSLGNFVFDQYFSKDTQEGLTVSMSISDSNIVYGLLPVISKRSQPELMSQGDGEAWLKELSLRSDSVAAPGVSSGGFELAY